MRNKIKWSLNFSFVVISLYFFFGKVIDIFSVTDSVFMRYHVDHINKYWIYSGVKYDYKLLVWGCRNIFLSLRPRASHSHHWTFYGSNIHHKIANWKLICFYEKVKFEAQKGKRFFMPHLYSCLCNSTAQIRTVWNDWMRKFWNHILEMLCLKLKAEPVKCCPIRACPKWTLVPPFD